MMLYKAYYINGKLDRICSSNGYKTISEMKEYCCANRYRTIGLYGLYYIPDSCVKKITGNIGWEGVIYSMDFKK
jgi:hypothetical protein